MSSSRRTRIIAAWATVVVLIIAGIGTVLLIGGRAGVGPLADPVEGSPSPSSPPPPPPTCPLSGVDPEGEVPIRPALAIKVENLPASRPQTGLSWADIVYEEPVEGGITRFIAVYQCQDAERVEPVRSARLSDPDILVQFDRPLFAYAGGGAGIPAAIKRARLIDLSYVSNLAADAFDRDPARVAPHDLFTSTQGLYRAARGEIRKLGLGSPSPVFIYSSGKATGKKVSELHVPFSSWASDVYWRWSADRHAFLRWHGSEPHVSSDGTQYSAKNVIVQVVKTVLTDNADANGVRSPKVISTGEGKAYVLRKGRIVVGKWSRPGLDDVTRFFDKKGNEIALTPGSTWVELAPRELSVTYG
jgi:hypothetical protein